MEIIRPKTIILNINTTKNNPKNPQESNNIKNKK